MSGMWHKLASENFTQLHRVVIAGYEVQVVDEYLTPYVIVKGEKTESKFPLDKIGLYYNDSNGAFYQEEDDKIVSKGELNDLAIETHLQEQA